MKRHGLMCMILSLAVSTVVAQDQEGPNPTRRGVRSNRSASQQVRHDFDEELQQLREELAAARAEREQAAAKSTLNPELAAENAERRREFLELLTQLATKELTAKKSKAVNSNVAPDPPTPSVNALPVTSNAESASPFPKTSMPKSTAELPPHPLISDKIVDPFALGKSLFKTGDFAGAEQAFRRVVVTAENRAMLQYLVATCLRKQNRLDEAAVGFRVVAQNQDDTAMRDLAKWQLEQIRAAQQTEPQLKLLRDLKQQATPLPSAKSTRGNVR